MRLGVPVLSLIAAAALPQALAEIVPLSLVIDPSSSIVHYVKGTLRAPAMIDLRDLKFVTTDDSEFAREDDDDNVQQDETPSPTDPPVTKSTPRPTPAPTDGETQAPTSSPGGGGATTAIATTTTDATTAAGQDSTTADGAASGASTTTTETDSTTAADDATDAPTTSSHGGGGATRTTTTVEATTTATSTETDAPSESPGDRRVLDEDAGSFTKPSTMDFIVFELPAACASKGCNWPESGVGAYDDAEEGGVSYCCTQDTIDRGICKRSQKGRLIIDRNHFNGATKTIDFPATGEAVRSLHGDDGVFTIREDGTYILVMANCNDYGREILAVGTMTWESIHGYLPADLYGLMLFYLALAVVYFVTLLMYGFGMKLYQDSAIPIQRFILATMGLGCTELFFLALDMFIWNKTGRHNEALMFPAIIIGVLKRGISRSLLVMVAMGWGTVRDTLGPAMIKIVVLGLIYVGLSGFRAVFVAMNDPAVQSVSTTTSEELDYLVYVLGAVLTLINIIYYIWIVNSIKSTTAYLKNMGQHSKLRRHNQLKCVIYTSFFIAAALFIFYVVDWAKDVLTIDQQWMFRAAIHANYVFVLVCVAILWRPTQNSKDYIYVMELSMDENGMGNELELSATVPSAMDGDEGEFT